VVMNNTGRNVFLWRPVNSTLPVFSATPTDFEFAILPNALLPCLYLHYRSRAVTIDYLTTYAKLIVYVTSEVRYNDL